MSIIYGYSEAQERMNAETDKPVERVAIDHDFYTNNHAAKKRAEKNVAESDAEGRKSGVFVKNNAYAMGGVVKERRGFYGE
jgi:hypothetical protein